MYYKDLGNIRVIGIRIVKFCTDKDIKAYVDMTYMYILDKHMLEQGM